MGLARRVLAPASFPVLAGELEAMPGPSLPLAALAGKEERTLKRTREARLTTTQNRAEKRLRTQTQERTSAASSGRSVPYTRAARPSARGGHAQSVTAILDDAQEEN
eukprot:2699752-Pyramimonas_sp.AAC.1